MAFLEEPEVFDVEDFGDGEAVVHFGEVDVARTDSGHRVRALRGFDGGLQADEARLLVQIRMVGGDAEPRDEHRPVRELVRAVGRREEHGGGAVGLRATVEEMQGRAHRR